MAGKTATPNDDEARLDAALAKRKRICKVAESPRRDLIDKKIADKVPIKTLERALATAFGERISEEVLTKHRDGVCSCAAH